MMYHSFDDESVEKYFVNLVKVSFIFFVFCVDVLMGVH